MAQVCPRLLGACSNAVSNIPAALCDDQKGNIGHSLAEFESIFHDGTNLLKKMTLENYDFELKENGRILGELKYQEICRKHLFMAVLMVVSNSLDNEYNTGANTGRRWWGISSSESRMIWRLTLKWMNARLAHGSNRVCTMLFIHF